MIGGQLLHAGRCHVHGKRGLTSLVRACQGQAQRSSTCAVASASAPTYPARRPSPFPQQRGSDNFANGKGIENGAPSPQQRQSSSVTRTSPVSIGRPLVSGTPPSSLGGSHTQSGYSGTAAYGCYRLFGPAHICKRGDCLIARLLPGSRLELLSGGGHGGGVAAAAAIAAVTAADADASTPPAATRSRSSRGVAAGLRVEADDWDVQCACASDDEAAGGGADGGGVSGDATVTECVLVAAYVELGGSASCVDLVDMALQPAVHHHNGHTYLSVRNLPAGAVITLSADGDLSHPVNVTPSPPSPEAGSGRG